MLFENLFLDILQEYIHNKFDNNANINYDMEN